MREYLLANHSDEERAFAAGLREDPATSPEYFVRDVFAEFDDPLLARTTFSKCGGEGADSTQLKAALDRLEVDGVLESSTRTQRPFDSAGVQVRRSTRP